MKMIKDRQAFFGDIWSIKTDPPRQVVILAGDKYPVDFESPQVEVALISDEINQATDKDLILDQRMIEFWNRQFLLIDQLIQLEGQLNPTQIDQLTRLILSISNENVDLSDLRFGTEISGQSDPRLNFQERERQSIQSLSVSILSLIDEREEMRAEVIEKWQQERELEPESMSIDWTTQQAQYISHLVSNSVQLPEYNSRLRLNEMALAILVESHTKYELDRLDRGQQKDLSSFEPIFRLDATPARSTLFDIGIVAINGHRINVRPTIEDSWILIDRRIFYQQLSDYFVGIEYATEDERATIFGYLSHTDAENLLTDYNRQFLALDVQQFLPVTDLYQRLATASSNSRSWANKSQPTPLDFDQLDLSLLVSDLPDDVYLQLLYSETEAEKYVQARIAFDQEIRSSRRSSTNSRKIEIFDNPILSFKEFVTTTDRLSLAAAGESPQKLVFDCKNKRTLESADIRIESHQDEFDFAIMGLPSDVIDFRFSILIFDQQAKQQFNSTSSLINIDLEKDFLTELASYLAALETEELDNQLQWIVNEFNCNYDLDLPESSQRVDEDGNILFGIDDLQGGSITSNDAFLILLYPDGDESE